MKNWLIVMMIVVMGAMFVLPGCETAPKKEVKPAPEPVKVTQTQPTDLRLKFAAGDTQKIRLTYATEYKTWVEMPNDEPTRPDQRQTDREIVLTTEVESVAPDGSAVVKVTLDKVALTLKSDVREKIKVTEYLSEGEKFKTDWANEPKLAGIQCKVKMTPDSTVTEVMGLEDIRNKLNIKEEDKGVGSTILSEKEVKNMLELAFIKNSPAKVEVEEGAAYALPKEYVKNIPLPDVMLKAQAIKQTYSVGPVQQKNGSSVIAVSEQGEALHVLPEGVDPPQEPNNFYQTMIKKMSNMQDMKITGRAEFDLTVGRADSYANDIECILILNEKDIGMGSQNTPEKDSYGLMFTTVMSKRSYEVIE